MEKQIYQKLANINRAVGAIGKNSRNAQQQFNFRGIDEVMNALHSSFAREGVIIIPEVLDFQINSEVTARNTKLTYTRARVSHHFVAEDGSEVVTTTVGEAMDAGDKGMNKALSIALKYALLQMFLIPTKEDKDPDANSYEVVAQAPRQTAQRAPQNAAQSAAPVTREQLMAQVNAATSRAQLSEIWRTVSQYYPDETQPGSMIYEATCTRSRQIDQNNAA